MTAAVGVGGAGHEASELLGVPLVGAHEATVARGRLSVARVVARHFARPFQWAGRQSTPLGSAATGSSTR